MDDEEYPNFYRKKDIQPQHHMDETMTADQFPPSDLELTGMKIDILSTGIKGVQNPMYKSMSHLSLYR